MATDNGANYFNILAPGETVEAMFIGSTSGTQYEGTLPATGDYKIRVYMMRSAARRNEVANYRLEMIVSGQGSSSSVGNSTQTPIPANPPASSSEPTIYPTADGFELNIGDCYARFDNNGTLLEGGSMCDDVELFNAREAASNYAGQLHNSSNSSSSPQIYPTADGFELNIGDCYARFDNNGTLLEGGSMCDDVELFNAREAARNYVGQ
jgi:hypothetical protein